MAITIPSDIVLDVARAADPSRQLEAVAKLQGASDPSAGTQFAGVLDGLETRDPWSCGGGSLQRPFASQSRTPEAYKQFEAFFLQNYIQSMLPQNTEANYGSGTAGSVWRSMLAEQMGKVVADNGGIGIAKQLMASANARADHELSGPFSLASAVGAKPHQDWASLLPYLGQPTAALTGDNPSGDQSAFW